MTGEENLRLMADLRHLGRREGRRRVAELLERFDLTDAARKPLATYSGGMRRRLDLAMTLVSRPDIVFLDEPTTGLDPRSRAEMWDIVRELVAAGTTILLTTQYLDEADELADRIAVLDRGAIVADGTPAELKRLVPGGRIRLEFDDAALARRRGRRLRRRHARRRRRSRSTSRATAASARSARSWTASTPSGVEARALSIHTPDLDDVFFALTGRATRRHREEVAR